MERKNEDEFPFDYQIYPVLEYLEVESLDKSYSRYLQLVKKHLDRHLKDVEYIESFFISFLSILFLNYEKASSDLMFWQAYPKDWKITAYNLESKSIISLVSLVEVIKWSSMRIDNILSSANPSYDLTLNKIFYNIFPETEPHSWANIFTFLFFPYSENKIEDVVNSKKIFGGIGRMTISWGGEGAAENKAEMRYKSGIEENKKLLKFVYRIIPDVFPPKGQIADYRGILSVLERKYGDDRRKIGRINELVFVLTILEEFIDSINQK